MFTRKWLVRDLLVFSSCMFVTPVAWAGFSTYSSTWPNDAASVNENAIGTVNTKDTAPDSDTIINEDFLGLPDRVPEYKRLYVKFGVNSSITQIRHIRNKSKPPLANLPVANTTSQNDDISWEFGVGTKMQFLRFEAEYLHHKKLAFNAAPIVVGNNASINSELLNRALLLNMYFDFDNDHIVYFKPYFGVLTGVVWNKTRSIVQGGGLGNGNARTISNYGLAWGVTVGARMPFWSNWMAYFAYRYTGQSKAHWKDSSSVVHLEGQYVFRGVCLGVQYII